MAMRFVPPLWTREWLVPNMAATPTAAMPTMAAPNRTSSREMPASPNRPLRTGPRQRKMAGALLKFGDTPGITIDPPVPISPRATVPRDSNPRRVSQKLFTGEQLTTLEANLIAPRLSTTASVPLQTRKRPEFRRFTATRIVPCRLIRGTMTDPGDLLPDQQAVATCKVAPT